MMKTVESAGCNSMAVVQTAKSLVTIALWFGGGVLMFFTCIVY